MKKISLLVFILSIFIACENKDENGKSGDEVFKEAYSDSQIPLIPLAVGYESISEVKEYLDDGVTVSKTTYDTIKITGKTTLLGKTVYSAKFNGKEGKYGVVNDTLSYDVKDVGGVITLGTPKFYINKSIRDRADKKYSTSGWEFEMIGARDDFIVNVNSVDLTVSGPTYSRKKGTEIAIYKFADWLGDVNKFYGLVSQTWYKDLAKTKKTSDTKLIKITIPK